VSALVPGAELPTLRVTPDRDVTARYAGASGDSNPIHLDDEFARSVGLPGRILHGLYTMALLARAQTDALGGPEHLKRLAVQFRGIALPEHEIVITSTVKERSGERVIISATAKQQEKAIIRGATAELEL
jgi:acyl dehydratase